MALMAVLGLVLLAGLVLAARWNGVPYQPGHPWRSDRPVRSGGLTYGRNVLVGFGGGFWAGLLVTGPAVRLIMRLLAVTAGDTAQGRITEADEVVGRISVGGTLGLVVFGGIFTGVLSGLAYVAIRRWLPSGRAAGPVFGLLHLVVLATRLDPLRPDNRDFDLVGPSWLAVATFSLVAVAHGTAVVAFVNRCSTLSADLLRTRRPRWAVAAALPPAVVLLPTLLTVPPIAVGLLLAIMLARFGVTAAPFERPRAVLAGRLAIGVLALAFLPGAVIDVADIIR